MSSSEGWEQTRSLQKEYSRHALEYSWKGGKNTELFFCRQLAGFAAKRRTVEERVLPATTSSCHRAGSKLLRTLALNSQKPMGNISQTDFVPRLGARDQPGEPTSTST